MNEDGGIINPNIYSRNFRKLINQHNSILKTSNEENGGSPEGEMLLNQIRLYDCRHSFATNILMSGDVPIKVVSEIMGHSSVNTTLNNYAHVTESMHRDAITSYTRKLFNNDVS